MMAPIPHTELIHPALCPELELHLLDRHSALGRAIKHQGLYAVHETFEGLTFPPYWAYAFASGQALARYVMDHPVVVAGRSVLDVGTGSGIAAIAAARAGARCVVAIDRDPLAIEAVRANADLNRVQVDGRVADGLAFKPTGIDVVLASDIFYGDDQLLRRLVQWADLRPPPLVFVADPGRGFVTRDLVVEVARYSARTQPDLEFPDEPVVYTIAQNTRPGPTQPLARDRRHIRGKSANEAVIPRKPS
ncbi:MAG TPA: 50S ribosomal protein L11 methyltransferase [Myxococcota bacterium]|nr:50S ribosomal protein L11 methyltransferase [Myxococcota bacterium]